MKWFSPERSKRVIDYSIRCLIRFEKVFAVVAFILTLVGTFLSPVVNAFSNDANTETKEVSESNDNIAQFNDVAASEIPLDVEIESLRTTDQKVFKKIDGTYEVAIYPDTVHYLKDGAFIDIDNTLVESGNELSNKDNAFDVKFPKVLSSNKKVKLTINDYKINWKLINSQSSNSEKKNNEANEKNLSELRKLTSSVYYSNVLPNTDIEYLLTGSKIKENIYVKAYTENLSLVFEYDVKDLQLVETEVGRLSFINDESTVVFSLDEMFMVDSEGNVSDEVEISYEVKKKDTYTITITPNNAWLKTAIFPVLIDPTVSIPSTGSTIEDTYVYQGSSGSNFKDSTTLKVGGSANYEYRSLIKLTLPSYLNNQIITYAHMEFKRTDSAVTNFQINVYKNLTGFEIDNVNWSNRPTPDTNLVDFYGYYIVNRRMIYDVTESVKEWVEYGVSNYGFTLIADSLNGTTKDLYSLDTTYSMNKPVVRIGYESPSGLKDYWTYTSQEVGGVGTGYVSDYTGNLTFVRNDYKLESEFMGLNLSFYYNLADRATNIGYGNGWKTNFNMKFVYDSTIQKNYLLKPDGNKVYFNLTSSSSEDVYEWNSYLAEDGSRMTVDTEWASDAYTYITLNTTDHMRYEFDSSGRLYQIMNTKTQQSIYIYYVSGDRLSYVTDVVNNRIDFTYTSNLLSKTELKLKQPGSSNYNVVEDKSYNYSSNRLTSITQRYNYSGSSTPSFTNGETLYYSFNSSTNTLTYAYNGTSRHRINYTYTTNSNKVATITTTDTTSGTAYLDKLTVSYSNGKTTYTNYKGEWVNYLFDDYGHTVNVLDSKGNAAYYKYSTLFSYTNPTAYQNGGEIIDSSPNYKTVHKLIESSDTMKQHHNFVMNHGFENINGLSPWTKNGGTAGTITQSTNEKNLGSNSLLISNLTGTTYAQQSVHLYAGTYTLTAWIKNNGVIGNSKLEVVTGYGTVYDQVTAVGEWIKATVYFDIENDDTVYIRLYNLKTNTLAYFDNVQLIEGFIDTRYNSITNHSFEDNLTNWSNFGASVVSNNETGTLHDILGFKSLQIIGEGNTVKKVRQSILNFVTEGETYIVGGWAKADAAPHSILSGHTSNRYFDIEVNIEVEDYDENPTTGEIITYYLPFNTSVEEWQYQMTTFTVPYNTMNVSIDIRYYGEGKALFDNVQLYHDKISTEYHYDADNGNLISKFNSKGITTEYNYDNNYNVIEITKGNTTIEIDRNYNFLVTEFSSNNVKTSFVYNSATKQITETIMGDQTAGGEWFKTSTTYSTDNQYITGTTDEFGKTTSSTINSLSGLVTLITDANADTKAFGYNNLGNLVTQTETDTANGYTIIKNFTYDSNRRISSVSIDGITYDFTYDNYDRVTNIKIAGIDYVTLSYLTELGTDGLTYQTSKVGTQIYSTGDLYAFTYTNENQVKTIKLNGNTIAEYTYDQSGRLTIYKDITNSMIYFYSYDLSGRIKQVTDQNGNVINYTYDSEGHINNYSYDIYGEDRMVYYYYDEFSGDYDYTYYNTGDDAIYKNYNVVPDDSLKRLNDIELVIGSSLVFAEYYTYRTPETGRGNASLTVGTITYKQNGLTYAMHSFTYDNVGNITQISVTGQTSENYQYKYDGFNRLVRENIFVSGYSKTILYEYDNYYHETTDTATDDNRGNITSIKTYTYSTSSSNPSGTPLTETRITYKTNGWKDQIDYIEYYINGTLSRTDDYAYDSIGNVTAIDSTVDESFEWDGRRLSSYTIGSTTYNYTYNDQGVRVSKTVDGISTEYFVDGYKVLAEKKGNNAIYYTYDADGSLLSMNYQDNEYFYIKNMQGDIIKMIDADGNTVAEYRYDGWGNVIYQFGSMADINPYRYRGYRFDLDSGLYYLNSRYYDSSIGRFISADSINYLSSKSNTGLNLYAYCGNNPIMNIDPSGKWFFGTLIGLISGAIVGAVVAAINGDDILTGMAIGAVTGALTGLAIDTLGGSALAMTAFTIGFGGSIASQTLMENKDLMDVNLIEAVGSGFLNMGFSALGKFAGNSINDFSMGEKIFATILYEFNFAGLGLVTDISNSALTENLVVTPRNIIDAISSIFNFTEHQSNELVGID